MYIFIYFNSILCYYFYLFIFLKIILKNDISRKMAGSFITFFGLPLVISLCISSVIPSDHSVNNKYMFLKDETNVEAVYNSEVLIRNFAYDGYLGYNDALDINYNNTEIYNSLTIKKNSLWTVVRSDSKFNSEKLKHMFYIRLRNTENKKFVRIDSK